MDRPTVDQYFIEMTHLVKGRGTCPRRQVGAVVVKDKRVLTTGYNGAPRGFPHPCDTGCIRDELEIPSGMMADVCPCLHAEQNAIIQGATTGVSIEGADIYCTTQPCTQCSRMIANCGLRRVIFEEEYADPLSIGLLVTAGVELWKWDAEAGEAHRYGQHNTFEEAQDALRAQWAGHAPREATQEEVRRTIQQAMGEPMVAEAPPPGPTPGRGREAAAVPGRRDAAADGGDARAERGDAAASPDAGPAGGRADDEGVHPGRQPAVPANGEATRLEAGEADASVDAAAPPDRAPPDVDDAVPKGADGRASGDDASAEDEAPGVDEEDVTVEGLRRLEEDPERQDIIRRMAATRKERLQRALDRND